MASKSSSSIKLPLVVGFIILLAQLIPTIKLDNRLQDTITLTLGIVYEAMPFIILGVALSVLVQEFVSTHTLLKILPKKSLFRRPLLSVSGVLLPVCECGNVPLARGLIAKGLKPSEVLTFLFAAPIINPVTIYTTTQAFQLQNDIVVIRVLAAFLIANGVGWLFARSKNKDLLTDDFVGYCHAHSDKKHRKIDLKRRLTNTAQNFQHELLKLMPALLAGSLVAGIIQTTIPRSLLTNVADQPALAIAAMLLLAFIISICANVDAFFALSLSSIFPKSAIIAFLVFGPMIDIKMLALLKTTFRPAVLIYASVCITLASFIVGLGVHYAL